MELVTSNPSRSWRNTLHAFHILENFALGLVFPRGVSFITDTLNSSLDNVSTFAQGNQAGMISSEEFRQLAPKV